MTVRILCTLTTVLLLSALAGLPVLWALAEAPKASVPGYDEIVAPFVKQHCLKCHGPERQSGNLRFDTLDTAVVKGRDLERWNDVRLRLLVGDMPPEKEPRPTAVAVKQVVDWIAAELKKNPKVTLRQPPNFHHPRFGNRLDHFDLFHPAPGTVASTPQRVWRLSGPGYATLLTDLRGKDRAFIQPFTIGSEGFTEYAALLLADEATATQLIRNAEEVVRFQSTPLLRKGGKRPEIMPNKEFINLVATKNPTRTQMEAAIRTQFLIVLLRDPTAEELKRHVDLMEKTIKVSGHELGVRTALAAVLLLVPDALYRTEFGQGTPNEHGRLRLAPRELAYALAFALTD